MNRSSYAVVLSPWQVLLLNSNNVTVDDATCQCCTVGDELTQNHRSLRSEEKCMDKLPRYSSSPHATAYRKFEALHGFSVNY